MAVRHLIPADAIIVSDPPYGMNANTDSRRFSGGDRREGDGVNHRRVVGDAASFDPSPWLTYASVTLWGGNHFAARLPVGTWLVWVKKHTHLFGTFLSDAEIAWSKGGHGVYVHRKTFPPPTRANEAGSFGVHPTQKPVSLMRWCIERSKGDGVIVDPYLGSGTTLVAAKTLGRAAMGIEIDERYCEIAARRCSQEVLDMGAA